MARKTRGMEDWDDKAYRAVFPDFKLEMDQARAGAGVDDESLGSALLDCAYNNDLKSAEHLVEKLARRHAPIDFVDWQTGLTALHIAVGRDHLDMAKFLIESGASFLPDKQGRTPSVIAAECEVSDEMCDFIAEAEAKAEGV